MSSSSGSTVNSLCKVSRYISNVRPKGTFRDIAITTFTNVDAVVFAYCTTNPDILLHIQKVPDMEGQVRDKTKITISAHFDGIKPPLLSVVTFTYFYKPQYPDLGLGYALQHLPQDLQSRIDRYSSTHHLGQREGHIEQGLQLAGPELKRKIVHELTRQLTASRAQMALVHDHRTLTSRTICTFSMWTVSHDFQDVCPPGASIHLPSEATTMATAYARPIKTFQAILQFSMKINPDDDKTMLCQSTLYYLTIQHSFVNIHCQAKSFYPENPEAMLRDVLWHLPIEVDKVLLFSTEDKQPLADLTEHLWPVCEIAEGELKQKVVEQWIQCLSHRAAAEASGSTENR